MPYIITNFIDFRKENYYFVFSFFHIFNWITLVFTELYWLILFSFSFSLCYSDKLGDLQFGYSDHILWLNYWVPAYASYLTLWVNTSMRKSGLLFLRWTQRYKWSALWWKIGLKYRLTVISADFMRCKRDNNTISFVIYCCFLQYTLWSLWCFVLYRLACKLRISLKFDFLSV